MENIKLLIPFSLPLLGESYLDLGNPVLISTINFFTEVNVQLDQSAEAHVPLSSPSLKRVVEDHLNSIGKHITFQVSPSGNDYLTLTSVLYIAASESLDDYAPFLVGRLNGSSLMTMVRSLSAISGGFVLCRKGEGLISLGGNLDASVMLVVKKSRRLLRSAAKRFHDTFPELSQPLWHTLGHIVIEGGKATKENNAKKVGHLMIIESAISCAIGLIKPKDLARLSRVKASYGAKMVYLGEMSGDLILSSMEALPLGHSQKFHFTTKGVDEIE